MSNQPKNAPLESIEIDGFYTSNNEMWIKQINQWKYLGQHEPAKADCDHEFFKIKHKKDIPMKGLREMSDDIRLC